MHFAAPIWLALLLPPWLALAAWLVWMRYGGTRVPFLELWRGPVGVSRAARSFRAPPLALVALIVAMLLAAIGAARPLARGEMPAPFTPTTGPTRPKANVAITNVAAVERPRPQVMVTVRNESADPMPAEIELRSGDAQTVERSIALPRRGQDATFFIDLPAIGDSVQVELRVDDGLDADNRVSLERKSATPRVEVRGDVPPEVRRVVEAYSRARPVGVRPPGVAIPPGMDEPGILVATNHGAPLGKGDKEVAAHPVTAGVDFASLGSVSATALPSGAWMPVVSIGGKPIVAVRETPVRQVWIGFDASNFARTPGFVVLWTNAINWVAGGGDSEFVASGAATQPTESAKMQAADSPAPAPDVEVAPWLALASLFCVFFASLTWSSG